MSGHTVPTTLGGADTSSDLRHRLDDDQKRNILFAMCTALIAVVASVSSLNVAQREIAASLGASSSDVIWIINAYTLALAALLMPVGAIGDRWGRRPVLLAGLSVFGIASLAAALAPSVGAMIAARSLTGIGAAMVMPVTLSVITTSFPEAERPRAIGIWAGFAGAGGILGLWMSAVMVDFVSWRWVFAFPLVTVALSGAIAVRSVPDSRERRGRFDALGSALSALATGGLVLGIHEGPERGWGDPLAAGPLVIGAVALSLFVLWELRTDHPLLDLSAFADRQLAGAAFTIVQLFVVMFGLLLVLFPFFQTVLGWSALGSAFGLMPMAIVMMPTSARAPLLAQRVGRRATALTGTAIAAVGLATLAVMVSVEGGYRSVLPGLLLFGFGKGLAMTPSTEAITASLPAGQQGVASALNDTSRELGGAVGIALLGSILTSGYRSNVADFAASQPGPIGEHVGDDYFRALDVAQRVAVDDPGLGERIVAAAQDAYVQSWSTTMWFAVVAVGSAFACLALTRPARCHQVPRK